MNGLVAYDSSDDEGADIRGIGASVSVASTGNVSVTQATDLPAESNSSSAKLTTNSEAPLVGPAAPSDHTQVYESYDEVNVMPDMSEREAIRFLTPASHPISALPASPPGSPNSAVSAKMKRFLDLKAKSTHFNEDLASKNAFKNPGLLESMIGRIGMSESSQYRTSLPPVVLNTSSFPSSAYKEALLENQQAIRRRLESEKKSQSTSATRTIDFESHGQSQL